MCAANERIHVLRNVATWNICAVFRRLLLMIFVFCFFQWKTEKIHAFPANRDGRSASFRANGRWLAARFDAKLLSALEQKPYHCCGEQFEASESKTINYHYQVSNLWQRSSTNSKSVEMKGRDKLCAKLSSAFLRKWCK